MKTENILNASDKLNFIDTKMSFLIGAMLYMDSEKFNFQKDEIEGLGVILKDLQDEIKEVKKLLK